MEWVVFTARLGHQQVWAWGLVDGGPGFVRVEFTDTTGCDPVELDAIPELTGYLFSVPARPGVADDETVIRYADGRTQVVGG